MSSLFRNLRLNVKTSLLGVGSVLVTLLAMVLLTIWQSGQYNALAKSEVDKLIDTNLDNITRGVFNLVQAEHEAAQKQVNDSLNVARHLLAKAGGVSLSRETTPWDAVNQFTLERTSLHLPKMLLGRRGLDRNADSRRETPVVDEVTRLVGDTATIFQRMNARGDMIRVATTVMDEKGRRAVGTYIPAVNPDGTPNPVLTEILAGRSYRGRAYVVREWYLTAYEPIRNGQGELVGVLYVGVRQKSVEARVRQAILQTTVGQTGYVYVLTGRGEGRGHYVISQGGERDGEDIWASKDSDGRPVIQAILAKALPLRPGELATEHYRWINPGDPEPRWKIARLAYFEPWDWVIGTSVYLDELQGFHTVLKGGRFRMIHTMVLAGAGLALGVGLLGILLSWTLTRPLQRITLAAQALLRGELGRPLPVASRDEIGTLAMAFNHMAERLSQTLKGLRESEQLYRGIFEDALEGILQSTPEGRILSANPALARSLGYESPEDLLRSLQEEELAVYVNPTQRKELIAHLERDGTVASFEAELYRRDGSTMWANLKASAVRDATGRMICITSLVEDITERKRVEDELHRINTVQSLILANTSIGIAFIKERRFEWTNQRMKELLGRVDENLRGASTRIIYASEEEFERMGMTVYPAMAKGERFEGEVQALRGDGTPFWARILGKALDSRCPQDGSIWLFEDIQDRKQAEEELRQVNRIQSLILDNSTVGIAFVRQRRFEWVNPRIPELFALSPEQFQNAPTRIIYPSDEAYDRLGAEAYPQLAEGRKAQIDLQLQRRDGTLFWCHFEGKALDPSHPQDGSIWLFEDIHDRKQAEESLEHYRAHLEELVELRTVQLRDAKEEAEAATRAKSTFLANMSHELRTPLNAVIGFAQLMVQRAREPEVRMNLERILHAGEHLLGLINDVLSISRIEAGRTVLSLAPFLTETFFQDINAMLQPRAQSKGLAFGLHLSSPFPKSLQGDAQKLRQVLVNLLGNAVKFTDRGSVELRVSRVGDLTRFEIRDTGIGMAAEDLARLFRPFEQVGDWRRHTEGTGLGLHISQSIVQLMGGQIEVISQPGQGAAFCFEVLLPEAEAPASSRVFPRRLRPGGPRPKQLVVDDVEDNRELLRLHFDSLGLDTRTAEGGEEALSLWESWVPEVVWMDLRMPGMDGWEASRRIRHREMELGRPRTTLIALTASALNLDQESLREAGFDDYLLKPIQDFLLLQKLEIHRRVAFEEETSLEHLDLDSDRLTTLDAAWTSDFCLALTLGDTEKMLALLDSLQDLPLSEALRTLVQGYQFERLKELFGENHA